MFINTNFKNLFFIIIKINLVLISKLLKKNDNKRQNNIIHYTPYDIDNFGGIGYVMRQIENIFGIDNNKCPIYVSFDIDGVCSSYIKGTGTRVRYGLTPREVIFILKFLR